MIEYMTRHQEALTKPVGFLATSLFLMASYRLIRATFRWWQALRGDLHAAVRSFVSPPPSLLPPEPLSRSPLHPVGVGPLRLAHWQGQGPRPRARHHWHPLRLPAGRLAQSRASPGGLRPESRQVVLPPMAQAGLALSSQLPPPRPGGVGGAVAVPCVEWRGGRGRK
jgi:hypothetical protein